MKKRVFMISQIILLAWFFLDMTGVYFKECYLVTRSYKEDGIFFFKEKAGKWAVLLWSIMWFVTQFMNHELVTITGRGYEGKMRYFAGSLYWLKIDGMYIPDVYHTFLHILILAVITTGIIYVTDKKETKREAI